MAEPTISLILTQRQRGILLDALADKAVETERYLSSYRATATPAETDLCCPTHRYRFEENQRQRAALADRLEQVQATTALIQNAVAESWDNSVPRELAGVLRDREDPASSQAAEWLAEHESDAEVWTLIGAVLDGVADLSLRNGTDGSISTASTASTASTTP